MIRSQQGRDLYRPITESSEAAGVPAVLLLACLIAESNLDERAERWGRETPIAKDAIERRDFTLLQQVIDRAGLDVSFGLAQRIVRYHWAGDQTMTVVNCLTVRDAVFADPDRDIWEAAKFLAPRYQAAQRADLSPVGGDVELMALTAYNAGSVRPPGDAYWTKYAGNVASYRQKLTMARSIIAQQHEPTNEPTEVNPMTLEERAQQLGPEKLGNGGQPTSEVIDLGQGVRVQGFWNCVLLELPTASGPETWAAEEATISGSMRPNP